MLVSSLTKAKEEENLMSFLKFWIYRHPYSEAKGWRSYFATCLEHWTWQTLANDTNSTACSSLINIFCKAFLDHEHVKMKNTDSTWNIDGISRKQAKTTDRTCECTYTEGPSILGIRLLVRVLVIGLDPGPSLQNHWTGRISSAWITLPCYVWF